MKPAAWETGASKGQAASPGPRQRGHTVSSESRVKTSKGAAVRLSSEDQGQGPVVPTVCSLTKLPVPFYHFPFSPRNSDWTEDTPAWSSQVLPVKLFSHTRTRSKETVRESQSEADRENAK